MSKLSYSNISEAYLIGPPVQRKQLPVPIPVPVEEKTIRSFEYDFFKLTKDPQFEEFIKNYVIFKHPEWLKTKESFTDTGPSKGNDDIKNYIIFFVISITIYLLLSLISRES